MSGPAPSLADWLLQLRLGNEIPPAVLHRLEGYCKRTSDEQRLMFASIIERTVPEALKVPLVIYRLYPQAVRIVLAISFGDTLRAAELRNSQIALLPAIDDCHDCHGRPLPSGESCPACGNPLWKINWLSAAD